jgi:hypothetical protein
VEIFLDLNGARICSIVGAAFSRGFELLEICLIDGLKKFVRTLLRVDFVHEEHIQGALLHAVPAIRRGIEFIMREVQLQWSDI